MANTTKSPTLLDANQTFEHAFNDTDKSFTTSGFVNAKVGHKVTVTAVSPTTDDYTFKDGSTTLQVIRLIFTSSAKDTLLSAERIA